MSDVQDLGIANEIAGSWKWVMTLGILMILLGMVAIGYPMATDLAVSFMFGCVMLIGGIASIIAGFSGGSFGNRFGNFAFGVLAVLAAIFTFKDPALGALSLVWAIGAMFAIAGIAELFGAFKLDQGRGWIIFLGIIDIALGLWLMVMNPTAALETLALIVGIGFMFRGFILFFGSFEMRKVAKAVSA